MMAATHHFLFGITAGAMLAIAVALRRAPTSLLRWSGIAFNLAVAAYALKLWNDEVGAIQMPAALAIHIWAVTAIPWFWIFVMALFSDTRRASPWMLAPVAVFALLPFCNFLLSGTAKPWIWTLASFGQIALMLHAVYVIVRGWTGDLVETRRKVRGPFFVTVAAYTLVTRAFETAMNFDMAPQWYSIANAIGLAAICIAGAFVFTDTRQDVFGAPDASPEPVPLRPAANGPEAVDRATRADLDRLEALMKTGEVWREEGLAIAGLAARVGVSETALRRLINDCLGYRNFPTYVNAHRIAAAKARLSDPHEARTPVSAIAFDLGFASLAPFNRAFREETGLAPSEWRRRELAGDSSIPEIA